MRIGIVGARGQLGTALQVALGGHEVVALGHSELDITDRQNVRAILSPLRIDCLINAAAYNFVDQAEDDPDAARRVNAIGPQNLAASCRAAEISFVHVSTDYVFGADASRRTPYRESDPPGPLGEYARSKLAGEELVRAEWDRHFIVRTCGLYGRSATAGKGNFVKTMLRLASQKSELDIVDDQECTPSSAVDVAAAIARLVETNAYGLYHATNSGSTTWFEFACTIFRLSGRNIMLRPILSTQYPQKAKRPAYSVLNCSKLAAAIGHPLPAWQDSLDRYLQDTVA
jgi:dTDP-4-dehydrorhamnose reductase